MKFQLAQNSWAGEAPVEIRLPESWHVEYLSGRNDTLPPLTKGQLMERLAAPIGSPSLYQLAQGKREVCLLIDDTSRGTPAQPVAEAVLEILLSAGVPKGGIRFLNACGAHAPMNASDFRQKLGWDIVREYPTYNHNPYEHCRRIGETSAGIPVELNQEFLDCDLRIGIGSLVPHPVNGFGGGGKIVMPGVASIQTIRGTHFDAIKATIDSGINPVRESGNLETSRVFRQQIDEIVSMSGFEFKIDCAVSSRKEIVDLFAGDPVSAYYAGCAAAKDLYTVSPSTPYDVVIANANFKGSEATIGASTAALALDPHRGGDLVMVNHVPFGQVVHYGSSAFGKDFGGFMWFGLGKKPKGVRRMILYTPYQEWSSAAFYCDPALITWASTWDEVERLLKDHGPGTRCGVFADATIQTLRQ